jgi:hypothetical protein
MVGIHLVNEYSAMLSSVSGEVGLRVTVDIELADHSPSVDPIFPHGGTHRFAVPRDFARKADIY